MKRTKKENSFKLNGISVALVAILSLTFNAGAFAAETAPKQNEIKKEDLSQVRMQIHKEKLEQELEKEKLSKLRLKAEQAKIEDQLNGVSATSIDSNLPQVPRASDEDKISKDNSIPQNVGFIYRGDNHIDNSKSVRSNNILDSLTGKKTSSNKDPVEGKDELSKVLEKFDEYKKVSDSKAKVLNEYVVSKTLLETDLDMLSIFDDNKSARLRFVYLHDDGIQKKKVISLVTVKEGRVFKIEDDTFKVDKIDSDGLVLVNLKNQEEKIVTKNN